MRGMCELTYVLVRPGQCVLSSVEKARQKAEDTKDPFARPFCTLTMGTKTLAVAKQVLTKKESYDQSIASFFGMITNIDDNIGKTRALLKKLGAYENTIFIFTTDNGTASGRQIDDEAQRHTTVVDR